MLYEISFLNGNTLQFEHVTMIAGNKQEAWDKVRELYGDNFEHRLTGTKKISDTDNAHQIWFRRPMPDGTKIQLEVWPNADGATEKLIGVYPICVHSESHWIRENETFRLTLCRIPQDKVYDLFHELQSGTKTLVDCAEYFYYGDEDAKRLGMNVA